MIRRFRRCRWCASRLLIHEKERPDQFALRQYCNRLCATTATNATRRKERAALNGTRSCEHCGEPMHLRGNEGAYAYKHRKFCRLDCANAAYRTGGPQKVAPLAERLPGTVAEAPPRCDRCGNIWTRVQDGAVSCVICGRQLYITAAVAALLNLREGGES